MEQIFNLLSIAPIQRGVIALIISGIVLPICGIPLIELNLLPLRFMLMHGALFAGAFAVAYGFNTFFMMILINVFFVVIITYVNRTKSLDAGRLSSFFMVVSLGGAALLTQVKSIPGQNVLALLWGSPYALNRFELILYISWALIVIILFIKFRSSFTAFLFDPVMAKNLGVKIDLFSYFINIVIAVSVALAMKLLGALLVDVLLILPVVLAGFWKKGQNFYFILSIIIGFIITILGTFGSLLFDLPVSGVMALIGGFSFLILIFTQNTQRR